ncbi:MAG: hypothetical protein IJO43_00355 [Bacilli bacterium]|nr:hypothetical protein [Bacilli bacterium]
MGKKEEQTLNEVNEQHNELKSRIDSLYGLSDTPVKKHTELSEEEKRQIRKKMVLLIWFCIFMGGLMIFNTIYPINNFFEKKEVVKVEEQEKLPSLPSGDVPLDNEEIQTMIEMFNFDINNPLYETNVAKLFNGKQEVEDMDFELQMFLLTSNDKFNKYIAEKTTIDDYYTNENDVEVSITTEQLNSIVKEIFGEEIAIDYQNFKYYYNYGEDNIVYFDAMLDESAGIYTFTPIEQPIKTKTEMHLEVFSANNLADTIYINYYVIYTNEKGIYGDAMTNNLLSNDTTKINDIITYGARVEMMFKRVVEQKNNLIKYYLISTNRY